MGISESLNEMFFPGMDPEQQKYLGMQSLIGMLSRGMAAGARSTDPRHGDPGYIMGEGLQGMLEGQQTGMSGLANAMKMQDANQQRKKQQALQGQLAKIPMTELQPTKLPDFGKQATPAELPGIYQEMVKENPEAAKEYFGAQDQQRSLTDILKDTIKVHIQAGDVEGATDMAGKLAALESAEKARQSKSQGDHYTVQSIKDKNDVRSIRLMPGEGVPPGYKIVGGTGASGEGMQLDPVTLKALATRFGASGEIPGMGMGKAATEARTKVLNQWAADLKKNATTPQEQLAQQATYKASAAELKRLQGQRGVVMSFANTAEKNLALVDQLSDKVDRTGVPVINKWLLAGKRSIAGDPDVSKFDAAVRTAINEYAKVTSSATGGGVTSDQARKEVESMLNTAQTKEQVTEVIKLLRQEMGNRKSGYDQQISTIQDAISGKKGTGKKMTFNPATGRFE